MNGKALIPLVAGLTIGGFALWMGVNALKSARGAQKPVENVKVWAAKSPIPHGAKITEDMIKPMAFPPKLIPPGAFQTKDDLIGRVPRIDAPAGLPVLEDMLLPPGAPDGLHVPAGYRAVAVKIDEGSGVDYHLEPGCFVDVVGSFSMRRGGRQETLARTVVENVQVGAVGQRVSRVHSEDEDGKSPGRSIRAVTLFVKPDDVPKLLLAEQKGRIKLSLRNDRDGSGRASNEAVRASELLGQKPEETKQEPQPSFFDRLTAMWAKAQSSTDVPMPVMQVDESWEVIVCRGETRDSVRFKNADSSERVVEEDSNKTNKGPRPSRPPKIPSSRSRPTPTPPSSPVAGDGDGDDSESQGA